MLKVDSVSDISTEDGAQALQHSTTYLNLMLKGSDMCHTTGLVCYMVNSMLFVLMDEFVHLFPLFS
jgi:hypothetical protein